MTLTHDIDHSVRNFNSATVPLKADVFAVSIEKYRFLLLFYSSIIEVFTSVVRS
jgi:hypothetical protein